MPFCFVFVTSFLCRSNRSQTHSCHPQGYSIFLLVRICHSRRVAPSSRFSTCVSSKIVRAIMQAYGGAYIVQGSKHLASKKIVRLIHSVYPFNCSSLLSCRWFPFDAGDVNYAWPTAEVAVMGAKVFFFPSCSEQRTEKEEKG
jgi:hypothetical protein